MLYIQRGLKQGFHIGDDIEITILEYDTVLKRATIGIEAPKQLKILRNELILKQQRESKMLNEHYKLQEKEHKYNKNYNK